MNRELSEIRKNKIEIITKIAELKSATEAEKRRNDMGRKQMWKTT